MARQQYPSDKQDQFMVRLPNGMRDKLKEAADRSNRSTNSEIVSRLEESFRVPLVVPDDLAGRIKVYADRHDRTVEEEILRLLDREYPRQWPVEDSLSELVEMLGILKAGTDQGDSQIDAFVSKLEETFDGIASGQISGVNPDVRGRLAGMWEHYKAVESERAYEAEVDAQSELDDEELESMQRFGNTAKFADPLPQEPNPLRDNIYLMNILPPRSLAELTKKLSESDLQGAAEVVLSIPRDELEKLIAFDNLPEFEKARLRGEEPPAAAGTDPFKVGD